MSLVNQSIIMHKMGLLHLAEELQNVSQACRVMGVSRDTLYRVKEAKESGCSAESCFIGRTGPSMRSAEYRRKMSLGSVTQTGENLNLWFKLRSNQRASLRV